MPRPLLVFPGYAGVSSDVSPVRWESLRRNWLTAGAVFWSQPDDYASIASRGESHVLDHTTLQAPVDVDDFKRHTTHTTEGEARDVSSARLNVTCAKNHSIFCLTPSSLNDSSLGRQSFFVGRSAQ